VKNVATFGVNTSVRITGTFSYIGSYGAYLTVCFGLLIAMLNIKQSPLWRLATILALLLVITNSLMNGSRSVVFALILFLIGYLGIKVLTQAS
jgi:Na+/H+-dicarboxylate symporter